MKDLIIIGAGGFGREVVWLVERINQARGNIWNILGFIDDVMPEGTKVGGYHVLGGCANVPFYEDVEFVCAVGSAKTRRQIVQKIKNIKSDVVFATLIDPSVLIGDRGCIGEGSIICAHSIVTVDVNIGEHVIINLDCTIGHDAQIKDFVTIYPSVNVSGCTVIGEGVELGTGAQIIQGKEIGEHTIVGAGAVIVKDMPSNCTAVGCPAKPINFFSGEK